MSIRIISDLTSEAQGRLSDRYILDCYLDMTHRKPKLENKWQGTGVEASYTGIGDFKT